MKEIVDRLMESKRLREARVGAFYFIGDKIISNDIDVRDADDYGGFKNYSSHWDLWRAFLREYPEYKSLDYDYFPRGRVIFDGEKHKYVLYIDPKLDSPKYLDKIRSQYRLVSGGYILGGDEHYESQQPEEDVDDDELEDDIIFNESLQSHLDEGDDELLEATKKTVYAVEYYESKIGKWVRYFTSSKLEDVKKHLDTPIIGNPKKRVAQYSVEGIRKPKYKFVKELKGEQS